MIDPTCGECTSVINSWTVYGNITRLAETKKPHFVLFDFHVFRYDRDTKYFVQFKYRVRVYDIYNRINIKMIINPSVVLTGELEPNIAKEDKDRGYCGYIFVASPKFIQFMEHKRRPKVLESSVTPPPFVAQEGEPIMDNIEPWDYREEEEETRDIDSEPK